MNNEQLLYIGNIGKISRKKLSIFVDVASNTFWKPKKGGKIFIEGAEYTVENFGVSNKGFSINLCGVADVNRLFGMAGLKVFAPSRDFFVESYSRESLMGCEVKTADGGFTGKVADVYKTPAGSILEVASGDKTCLIPFKKEFVKKLDWDLRQIVVELIDGMV